MPSAQLQTTSRPIDVLGAAGGRSQVVAGSRHWLLVWGGTGSDAGGNLYYSDNEGASWTKHEDVSASTGAVTGVLCAYQDAAAAWHLAIVIGAGNNRNSALTIQQIHTNVATGVPAASTVPVNIDAGGTDLGCRWPSITHSPSASNRRLWVSCEKSTSATSLQANVYFCAEGTAADTATNWSNTNFTNLGSTASSLGRHQTTVEYWATPAGAPRVTCLHQDPTVSPWRYLAQTWDPSLATPTPGATTVVYTCGGSSFDAATTGMTASMDESAGTLLAAMWDLFDGALHMATTEDGVTWSTLTTAPVGYAPSVVALPTAGEWTLAYAAALITSIANYSDPAPLKTRHIQADGATINAEVAFSDQNGVHPDLAVTSDGSHIVGIYRVGTASLYGVRYDSVATPGPPPDTTAPEAATNVTHLAAASGRADIKWKNSASTDLTQVTVRRALGATPPATATSGVEALAWRAATPAAAETLIDTGLTNGSRYSWSVFGRDAALNVSPAASVGGMVVSPPVKVSPADGAVAQPGAVVLVVATAAANVESGFPVHFIFEVKDGAGVVARTKRTLTGGVAGVQYEDSPSTWLALPSTGLASAKVGVNVRWTVDPALPDGVYTWRVRFEQS